jgi:hypothetical protein
VTSAKTLALIFPTRLKMTMEDKIEIKVAEADWLYGNVKPMTRS